jgi:hypothetical protein
VSEDACSFTGRQTPFRKDGELAAIGQGLFKNKAAPQVALLLFQTPQLNRDRYSAKVSALDPKESSA